MIATSSGDDKASIEPECECECVWAKCKELAPILTFNGASFIVQGRHYKACEQLMLIHGSETWQVTVEDMQCLERTECMKVRWMCCVSQE